jgi:hypothetical protein
MKMILPAPARSDPAPTSKTKKKSAQPSARTGRPGFAAPLGAQPPTDKEHDPASLKCQSAHTPETATVTATVSAADLAICC